MSAEQLDALPLPALRGVAAAVDALIERIYRAGEDELNAIEDELVAAIDDEWSGRIPGALEAALDDLDRSLVAGTVTEIEAVRLLDVIKAKMVTGFAESVTGAVTSGIDAAYERGRAAILRPLQLDIAWNLVDEHARKVLQQDTMYWVGSAWDRQLGQTIADAIRQQVIEQGLGRKEAGAELQRILGTEFPDRSRAYWEVVASAGVVRSRTFGAIESFVQAEAVTYQWLSVEDARTCPTCGYLDGKVFTVQQAVAIRDRVLGAEDPEAAKAAHPWATAEQVVGKGTDELEAAGFSLPPIHGRCRCVVVVASFAGER